MVWILRDFWDLKPVILFVSFTHTRKAGKENAQYARARVCERQGAEGSNVPCGLLRFSLVSFSCKHQQFRYPFSPPLPLQRPTHPLSISRSLLVVCGIHRYELSGSVVLSLACFTVGPREDLHQVSWAGRVMKATAVGASCPTSLSAVRLNRVHSGDWLVVMR